MFSQNRFWDILLTHLFLSDDCSERLANYYIHLVIIKELKDDENKYDIFDMCKTL